MDKSKEKIKILATVFPYDIKLLFVVQSDSYVKDLKNYILESVRGLNLQGFQIGRITNTDDYILLNDQVRLFNLYKLQKIGDLLTSGDSILVYSVEYKIDSKILGGRNNPKHYLGNKRPKDQEDENNKSEAPSNVIQNLQKQKNNNNQKDNKENKDHKSKHEVKSKKPNNDHKEKEIKKHEIIKEEHSEEESSNEEKTESESESDNEVIPPKADKLHASTVKKDKKGFK